MKTFLRSITWKSVVLGVARYALAIGMIPYAITKILRTQFVILPVGISQVPLEQIDGSVLAWAFLGYAPWFQVLLGFLELIPSLLLLFRKTALAGALLMIPVLLNVCLINFALDLWSDTQLISSIFLFLNIVVLLFYLPQLKRIVENIFYSLGRVKFKTTELIFNVLVVILVVISSSGILITYIKETNQLTGDWYHQEPVEWRFVSADSADWSSPVRKSIFFGPFGSYGSMENGVLMNVYSYSWDTDANEIKLSHISDSSSITYNILQLDEDKLVLAFKDTLNRISTETYEPRAIKLGQRRKKK